MARYTGPKAKICRRFGINIYGNPKYDRILEKRPNPPGDSGQNFRRKLSDYGVHLKEKQKVRMTYCLLERQFRNYYKKAAAKKGITGDNLFQMLEMRLDNIVYRMGIAVNRMQSRQFVNHRHIVVNGRRVNIASFMCKPGDVVEVYSGSKTKSIFKDNISGLAAKCAFEWLSFDEDQMRGEVLGVPARDQIPVAADDRLIVEFYSK